MKCRSCCSTTCHQEGSRFPVTPAADPLHRAGVIRLHLRSALPTGTDRRALARCEGNPDLTFEAQFVSGSLGDLLCRFGRVFVPALRQDAELEAE